MVSLMSQQDVPCCYVNEENLLSLGTALFATHLPDVGLLF